MPTELNLRFATPHPSIPFDANLPNCRVALVEIARRLRRIHARSRRILHVLSVGLALPACYGPEPLPAAFRVSRSPPAVDASRDGRTVNGSGPLDGTGPDAQADGSPVRVPVDAPTAEGAARFDGPKTAEPVADRLVAMGDLHSDIGSTRAAFRLAGAIDENDEWVGGDLRIVQLGDFIGRSDDEREVVEFLLAIRGRAAEKGGAVHVLLGNHEVMGGRVDFQAVGPNPFPGWEDLTGLDLEDPRVRFLPDLQRKRGAALMAGGPYARKLADFPTVLRLGDTIYVHGGVVPRWAQYGLDRINWEVSQWLRGETPEPDSSLGVDSGDRVMWTRVYSSAVDAAGCALLEETLRILGAKRMIVAHTVQQTITPRCNDKVWAVDVGMSRAYGGPIEVLQILEDDELTVLRE